MILQEPAPIIGVKRNDDNAVVIDLLAWCETDEFFNAEYYLKEEVKKAFDENGISIPFPQIDVHMKGQKAPSDQQDTQQLTDH